jgi:hypothetical protein
MEEVRKVETTQVDQKCPVCQQGYMRPTGITIDVNPPQFPHKCTNCGWENVYSIRYPYIVQQ